ncbi:hydantoinase/oxoprolinase family protein, partial [Candidatus Pacearchaeota archaeon]|nr:hydantoinase/oxoprolinase family protein [Candidatus Pacearchaeota archaeon]
KPLSKTIAEAAVGIQQIVNNNIADQLRLISVYKGFHPKDFSLIAFGGAGPVCAGRLMQILGMKEVIIPISPGVLSAFGLLTADIEHEEVASCMMKAAEVNPKDIMKIFNELYDRCEKKRKGVGISETKLHVYRSTEMRYVGQSYELEVPFPEGRGEVTKRTIYNVVRRFHDIHQSIYQHCLPNNPVEFIAFRVVFSQKPQPVPAFRNLERGVAAIHKGHREVYFEEYNKFVNTPLYERAELVQGQKLEGPAIVEQTDTTTVIYPDQIAEVDRWGNLILTLLKRS